MRKRLQALNGQRVSFTGLFWRLGRKLDKGEYSDTVLLLDIRNTNDEWVCDHLWVESASGFQSIPLYRGVRVAFEALVHRYQKGCRSFWGHTLVRVDYGIVDLTNVRIVTGLEGGTGSTCRRTSTTDILKRRRPRRLLEE